MIAQRQCSTSTNTCFPYTTLFRSRLDTIGRSRALLDQPLALARRPAGILLLRAGHPHHAHHPRLAAPVGQQGAYHLLAIDTIGLGPPRAPVDGQTGRIDHQVLRSEEHTSELQSLMRISYAVFCLKKKKIDNKTTIT